MNIIESGMEAEVVRYHEALSEHESIIRTALHVYIEKMEENAKECEAAFEAGQKNPEVRAKQDASYMTNNGLRQLAVRSRQSAASARKASDDILNAVLGPEEDEGEG